MKIALVHTKYTTHGGTERFIFNFTRQLLEMGHEVHLVVGKVDCPVDSRITVHKAPVIKFGRFIKILSFLFFSQQFIKGHRFDVVQGFGRTIRQDFFRAGGGCHKEYRKNVLSKIKNPIVRYLKLYLPHQLLLLYIEKRQFSRENFRKIIAVSEQVKKELIVNYGLHKEEIEVVYNGVDIETFNPRNKNIYFSSVREKFHIRPDEKVILFVGTGFERKGLYFLIRALAVIRGKYPDTRLLVVGRDSDTESYMHLSKELGIYDKVIFAGPQSDVKMFYAAADIFVFPTIYEPFGNVCLEAMASGLPVITSKVNGASEIMGKMNHLLLDDPRDIEEIARKIEILLGNDLERAQSAIIVRQIAERYTITNNALRFVELYNQHFEGKFFQ